MRRHDQNSKPRVPHLPRLPAVLPPQPEVRVADPGPGALPADHDQLQSALRPGGPRLQVSAAAALRSAMAPPAGAEPRSSHSPRRSAALRGRPSAVPGDGPHRAPFCWVRSAERRLWAGGGGKVCLQVFCRWSVVGLNSLCLVGEAGGWWCVSGVQLGWGVLCSFGCLLFWISF